MRPFSGVIESAVPIATNFYQIELRCRTDGGFRRYVEISRAEFDRLGAGNIVGRRVLVSPAGEVLLK